MNLGFLASHRGSDVQAVLEACASGRLAATPRLVISNNAEAEVLQRARRHGEHVFLVDTLARIVSGELALR